MKQIQTEGSARQRPIELDSPAAAELPLGCWLVTPRRGYTHHGIYVGDGQVVHYSGLSRSWRRGPVEVASLSEFSTGAVACGRGPLSGHDQQLRALLRMVPRRRDPKPADRAVARMAARDARRARASVRPRATVAGPVLTMRNRCPLAGSFAKSSSLPGPRKVRTGTALLLCAVVAAARAQSPVERPVSADPDLLLNLPYSMRLELGLSSKPEWSAGTGSAVLTSNHRLRMLEERTQQQTRYGVNLVDQATSRSHLLLQFPGGRPLAGLQYERKNFLCEGDQLSI